MSALLIADGLIATTTIAERVLRDAYGDVQVVVAESLVGVSVLKRPVFISRLCHPRYSWLPAYLHQRGCPYVYLLDDNFFELTVDYDAANGAFFSHPAVHESLEVFLAGASRVWLMSKPLETYLRRRLPGLATCYVPAPVDIQLFDQQAEHAALLTRDALVKPSAPALKVGYPSTRRVNMAPLIQSIVERVEAIAGDSVQFEFIGWCPDAIASHPNVTVFQSTTSYAEFLALMFSRCWDVAIAPLGDTLFENCKTSLKYREYGAARIAGVYSQCELFKSCVNHGENGLLAGSHAEEWAEHLVALRDQPALRESITVNARRNVEAVHHQSRVADEIRRTFASIWG